MSSTRTPTPPDSTVDPGNYTYTGAPSNRIDGKYIDTSQPIFTYYDADGNADHADADHDDRGSAQHRHGRHHVRVRVHADSRRSSSSQRRVHVRNVDYNPNS